MVSFLSIARFLVLVGTAPVLAACQTLGGTGLVQSTATAELSPDAAATIAADMVGRFAEKIGPGMTTIALRPDGSTFGQALETSLRSRGYAIATNQDTDGTDTVMLAYVVDLFEGGILVRLSTHEVDLTRIYEARPDGAVAISPLSIMERRAGEAA